MSEAFSLIFGSSLGVGAVVSGSIWGLDSMGGLLLKPKGLDLKSQVTACGRCGF
jgi:hypothetical protein